MKLIKTCICTAALMIMVFCMSGCNAALSVTEIDLGDNLPKWQLNQEHTVEKISDDEKKHGVAGIYVTDTDDADVHVYNYPKKTGVSLEEFGQQQASKYNVFCNMMTDRNIPVAVLNYHECIEDEHYIVQAYIYEGDTDFVEVCTMFKTDVIPLGVSDLSVRMIRDYEEQIESGGPLIYDEKYVAENDRLPLLRVKQFEKSEFPVEFIEPGMLNKVSDRKFKAFAKDGWTLKEIVSFYDENYKLIKGEVISRNNLKLAFMGYIDDGVFKTRAVINDNNDYVMLGAEAEASEFQHVTNALIDTIEKQNMGEQ